MCSKWSTDNIAYTLKMKFFFSKLYNKFISIYMYKTPPENMRIKSTCQAIINRSTSQYMRQILGISLLLISRNIIKNLFRYSTALFIYKSMGWREIVTHVCHMSLEKWGILKVLTFLLMGSTAEVFVLRLLLHIGYLLMAIVHLCWMVLLVHSLCALVIFFLLFFIEFIIRFIKKFKRVN